MRTDPRLEEEESEAPEESGLLHRLAQSARARELRVLDGLIGFFQGWRTRVAPPEDEEDDFRGRRRGAPEPEPPPAAPVRGGGLRRFLIVVALLTAAGFGGMLFSYSLLSRTIEADEMLIDDLRDELAQMNKADARNVSVQAKSQALMAEQKKTLREYEVKLEEYEGELAQLRQQVATLTAPPVRAAAPAPYRGQPRPVPQKTGKCTATGGSAAADIARCLEEFNRP